MVDRDDPGAGDPSAIRGAAGSRRENAERIASMSSSVRAASVSASGVAWTGVSQVRFQTTIDETLPDLDSLAVSLSVTADALDRYADAVAGIKDDQVVLERRRSRLEDERSQLKADWQDAYAASQGPYISYPEHTARAEQIRHEIRDASDALDQVADEWDALVRRRERADQDLIGALSSRDVRGGLYVFASGSADRMSGAELLEHLSTLSPADLRALAAAHPDLLGSLRRASPEEVAAWWAGLGDVDASNGGDRQQSLIDQLPIVMGALGGLPTSVRVTANRALAGAQLKKLREQMSALKERGYGSTSSLPYADEAAIADYLEKFRALETETAYLERVMTGEVQLYLYNPRDGQIIEMFGNPDTADSILSFMPGTNTTMQSFYTSTKTDGITALTRWQVENALRGTEVAGFVVKQGSFPTFPDDVFANGPQWSFYASALGRPYADFAGELDVIASGAAVVSVEHSFGSAVAGKAETAGAEFDSRYILSGIGMTNEWEPREGTAYYAAQGPGDVNRYLDGVQHDILPLGYGITPTAENGIIERPSGLSGGEWAPYVLPIAWPVAVAGLADTALTQHNNIISADETVNGPVLRDVRRVLEEAQR